MNNVSIIILLFSIINIFIIYIINTPRSKVLLIVILWWFGWLFISSLSLTGLTIPSLTTYVFFIAMLCFISIGGIFYRIFPQKSVAKWQLNNDYYKADEEIYDFLIYTLLLLSPIILFFVYKAMLIAMTLDTLEHYRGIAFGLEVQQENLIFGNIFFKLLILDVLGVIILASYFIGCAYYIVQNKKSLMILAAFLLIAKGAILLGRFDIYYVLVLTLLSVILKKNFKLFNMKNLKIFIILIIMIVSLFMFSSFRDNSEFNFVDLLNKYLVNYHTCSFLIFDEDLKNSQSLLYDYQYGRILLSKFDYFLSLFFGKIGLAFEPVQDLIGNSLHEGRILGYDESGMPYIYNAFATIYYALFMDGGLLLTSFFSLGYGFFLVKSYNNAIKYNSIYKFSLVLALMHLGIFGLFMPLQISNVLIIIILLFLLFRTNIIKIMTFKIKYIAV